MVSAAPWHVEADAVLGAVLEAKRCGEELVRDVSV
jgi:hypothetical protein